MKKIIVTNKLLLLAPALVFCFLSCESEPAAKLVIKNNSTNITIETVKAWEATDEFLEYKFQAIRFFFMLDMGGALLATIQAEEEAERIFSKPPLHQYTVHISPGKKKAFDVKKEKNLLVRINDNNKYKEDVNVGSEDSVLVLTDSSLQKEN